MSSNASKYWIDNLQLEKHPEGGFFREVYRSQEQLNAALVDDSFQGNRNICTAIYYLLDKEDTSSFHRIKSDEIWHFYDGTCLLIHAIDPSGCLTTHRLGKDFANGEIPQVVIPKGQWFAAEVKDKKSFALVGCTVSPGFDFVDFEMAQTAVLKSHFPKHSDIIQRLTQ